MKGYKGMTKDMTCRGMKFEVGKTYHVDGEIEICKNGLHFCQNLIDVFDYYNNEGDRYFEIETDAEVVTRNDKSVTAELKVIREIDEIEVTRTRYGNGDGNGDGDGYGYGDGNGYGYGDGYGYGYGYGNGDGYGYGDGYGDGNGRNIQKVLNFNN